MSTNNSSFFQSDKSCTFPAFEAAGAGATSPYAVRHPHAYALADTQKKINSQRRFIRDGSAQPQYQHLHLPRRGAAPPAPASQQTVRRARHILVPDERSPGPARPKSVDRAFCCIAAYARVRRSWRACLPIEKKMTVEMTTILPILLGLRLYTCEPRNVVRAQKSRTQKRATELLWVTARGRLLERR